ncbi:MAG: hypothetical protein ALECFALPRED_008187, partial [Alectoria fallacina]
MAISGNLLHKANPLAENIPKSAHSWLVPDLTAGSAAGLAEPSTPPTRGVIAMFVNVVDLDGGDLINTVPPNKFQRYISSIKPAVPPVNHLAAGAFKRENCQTSDRLWCRPLAPDEKCSKMREAYFLRNRRSSERLIPEYIEEMIVFLFCRVRIQSVMRKADTKRH